MSTQATFTADSPDALDAQIAEWMRARGWTCIHRPRMEFIGDVRKRYGLSSAALCMRLKRFNGEFPVETGARRITRLHVTPDLHAYLSRQYQNAGAVGGSRRELAAVPRSLK